MEDPVIHADVIKEIKNSLKKNPGESDITNEVLINLAIFHIPKLTLLLNSILEFNYIPHYWKTAIIAPVQKLSKPPVQVSSYRPISVLDSQS